MTRLRNVVLSEVLEQAEEYKIESLVKIKNLAEVLNTKEAEAKSKENKWMRKRKNMKKMQVG